VVTEGKTSEIKVARTLRFAPGTILAIRGSSLASYALVGVLSIYGIDKILSNDSCAGGWTTA
jgi:hypothetical protein